MSSDIFLAPSSTRRCTCENASEKETRDFPWVTRVEIFSARRVLTVHFATFIFTMLIDYKDKARKVI